MSTKEVFRDLLQIELHNYALRLGLIAGQERSLDDDLLKKIISVIDELRWDDDSFSRRLATQLIAITWEHASTNSKYLIKEFFIVVLSRLGIAPSTGMIDYNFRSNGIYSPVTSYFTELQTFAHQAPNEFFLKDQVYLLTQFQFDVLCLIEENRLIGISAPTSAGKSFAIYLAIARHLLNNQSSIVYIVPTLSLVSQVSRDLRSLLDTLKINHIHTYTTYKESGTQAIYVLTQERAMGAFEGVAIPNKCFLVVDEVQNLERVAHESDQRAKILYDLLKDLKDSGKLEKIVLSGPRLSNIGNIGFEIFGEPSEEQESNISPVMNITYSIDYHKGKYDLNQYVDTLDTPNSIKITQPDMIKGFGQSRYTEKFINYLSVLIDNIGPSARNIIFSPTVGQARNTAIGLCERRSGLQRSELRDSLVEYLKRTVHPDYTLAETVNMGVAYHTGRVPTHARSAIEEAFRQGIIKDLVCTTTLMQGVNLPATTVIVRNPNLFVQRRGDESVQLSPYEFANLRGRAGRLLKDFVGRTIVLEENAFATEDAQEDMFKDEYKELTPGYQEAFDDNRDIVIEELRKPDASSDGGHKFLVTYIRQTLLRLGVNAYHRLHEVGIYLTQDELNDTTNALNRLTIPRSIILRHRYWDPFDLETLYTTSQQKNLSPLPTHARDSGVAEKLHEIITFHAEHLSYYFEKNIKSSYSDGFIWALALSSEQWAREDPLIEILVNRNFTEDISKQIDDQIKLLMNYVVYGVTTLLKPYADICGQGVATLSAIEWGAYHPVTRVLIERGVARDTAIEARKLVLNDLIGEEEGIEHLVSDRIQQNEDKFDYWTWVQLSQ